MYDTQALLQAQPRERLELFLSQAFTELTGINARVEGVRTLSANGEQATLELRVSFPPPPDDPVTQY